MPIKNLTCGVGLLLACSAYSHDQQHYTLKATSPLSAVAKVCKVKLADIAKANGLHTDAVVPKGTRLTIPTGNHSVQTGNTAVVFKSLLAHKTATHVSALPLTPRVVNPHALFVASAVHVGHTASAAASGAVKKYVVQHGENNWIIAHKAGVKLSELVAVNPKIDVDSLKPGQTILLPARANLAAAKAKRTKTPKFALVARDRVSIRRGPSSAAERVTVVDSGLHASVLAKQDGWYKLKFPKGTVGWIRNDFISPTNTSGYVPPVRHISTYSARRMRHGRHYRNSGSLSLPNPGGSEVVATASTYLGTPYSYGSASRSSTDCSGLVKQVYARKGVKLPRTSREMANVGQHVGIKELKPGDMVFFKTRGSRRINHVGIYAGNGKFIHASSGGGRVQVNSLSDGYYANRIAAARRVVTPKKKK